MLTPEQIENKEFKKSLRGYREDEVDEFLDIIKEDFETLKRENKSLKEKVELFQDQVNKYENIEETLKATLITAQSAAEDTCNAANRKAKVIVEEANLKSRQIMEQANNRVIEIRKEYDALVKEFKVFRNKFKSLLEDEIRSVDEIFYDVDESCQAPFESIDMYQYKGENDEAAATFE
ncbi:DivIVA domain-containing protein [Asaccharospora irregularis]|uniref:Cell division initiation protein n=1 Tax=Asaccharospora irregularis DSM 2635 TaxID=1121321 RepID=A0A1M5MG32_9FIRM|nr:DivIVA domain-containing protein [Asaccharospora irregularis]SHG76127.1 cell division initiation protein [Asaccharospora irregularis DSM 2635]